MICLQVSNKPFIPDYILIMFHPQSKIDINLNYCIQNSLNYRMLAVFLCAIVNIYILNVFALNEFNTLAACIVVHIWH